MMLRRKSVFLHILWLMPLALLLSFSQGVPQVLAGPDYITFSGTANLKVTMTEIKKGKFSKKTIHYPMTVEIYTLPSFTPTTNGEGYFAKLVDHYGNTIVAIDKLALLSTAVPNKTNQSLQGTGAGKFFNAIDGVPTGEEGPASMNINPGKVWFDSLSQAKKAGLKIKLSGGTVAPDGIENHVWTAQASVTLYPKPM